MSSTDGEFCALLTNLSVTQSAIFSYRILEQQIPPSHPLSKFRRLLGYIAGGTWRIRVGSGHLAESTDASTIEMG